MAEFRKRCINFEETGNIVDKKHAPDPPGYDLVVAKDMVRLECLACVASSAGHIHCMSLVRDLLSSAQRVWAWN